MPTAHARGDPSGHGLAAPEEHMAKSSSPADTVTTAKSSSPTVNFFVRTIDSKTLAMQASRGETVGSVIDRLEAAGHGRDLLLIHAGRQLPLKATLAELSLPQDSTLHLASRLRSTRHSGAWKLASHIADAAAAANSTSAIAEANSLHDLVEKLLSRANRAYENPCPDPNSAIGFQYAKKRPGDSLDAFIPSGAAVALVRFYLSEYSRCRHQAERTIRSFVSPDPSLTRDVLLQTVPMLIEFGLLLRSAAGRTDPHPLYMSCRCALAKVLGTPDRVPPPMLSAAGRIDQLLQFASETAEVVMNELAQMPMVAPVTLTGLMELSSFFSVLCWEREYLYGKECHDDIMWIEEVHAMLVELLKMVDECLKRFEKNLPLQSEHKGIVVAEPLWVAGSYVLALLQMLDSTSVSFEDMAHYLQYMLQAHKALLNVLVQYAKRDKNLHWLGKYKDLLGFEARRNLVLMMLPEGKDDHGKLYEMLIHRSQLLAESFEYITQAKHSNLHGCLCVKFMNEEATGPGVLREWFCMVCHALFSPRQVLFLPCPNDRRRFYLNPTSAVDPLHLKYFMFSGRIIGLALMHKVQVGILFDRTLFSQLAGRITILEDIADTDPCLYESCRKILEMDADLLDSDALGLTFVREVDELGSRKVIELCPGGQDIAVNGKNRERYINLLIQDCFAKSMSVQLSNFAQGFSDMLVDSDPSLFFGSLDLEDFDRMLGGCDSIINVKDWKSHTEYTGYKENDCQITWFWKAVDSMPIEQQRWLLFFWTSVKFLPSNGFSGLGSTLYIYRTSDSQDCLPTSHTCFYRLCLPPYRSSEMMESRLQMITQEHVSCSFGNW